MRHAIWPYELILDIKSQVVEGDLRVGAVMLVDPALVQSYRVPSQGHDDTVIVRDNVACPAIGLYRYHIGRHDKEVAFIDAVTGFYIPDAHLSSKSTFALLLQLFELQAGGGAESVKPVLTLSVGR